MRAPWIILLNIPFLKTSRNKNWFGKDKRNTIRIDAPNCTWIQRYPPPLKAYRSCLTTLPRLTGYYTRPKAIPHAPSLWQNWLFQTLEPLPCCTESLPSKLTNITYLYPPSIARLPRPRSLYINLDNGQGLALAIDLGAWALGSDTLAQVFLN